MAKASRSTTRATRSQTAEEIAVVRTTTVRTAFAAQKQVVDDLEDEERERYHQLRKVTSGDMDSHRSRMLCFMAARGEIDTVLANLLSLLPQQ